MADTPVNNTPDIDNPSRIPLAKSPAEMSPDTRAQAAMSLPTPAGPTPDSDNMPAVSRPQPQATPNVMAPRRGLFDRVLEAYGPTPVRDAQGNVVSQPMTKKGLTAHILAGAVTGIIRGAMEGGAAARTAPAGPAGTVGPANAAALGAGAQAGSQAFQEEKTGAQTKYDTEKLRQYNTMLRNIDLTKQMIALGSYKHETALKAIQPQIDLYNQAKQLDAGISDPSQKLILDDSGLTGPQVMEKYKGKFSMNDFIPMGMKPMYNVDGTPLIDEATGLQHEEPIFAVINPNATMPATDELKEQLKYTNPNADKIPANAQVRLSNALMAATFQTNGHMLQAAGETWGQELAGITGDASFANIDLAAIAKKNRVIRAGMPFINQYNSLPVDEMLAALGKDKDAQKAAPGVEGVLAHELGMDKTVKYRGATMQVKEALGLQRKDEAAKQRNEEERQRREADAKIQLDLNKKEKDYAASLKNRVTDPPTSSSTPFLNNWKDPKTGTNYDLSHPSAKLVEGTLSPSELSKRATKGSDGYNATIRGADDYSMAKYGKPFDFEQADRDFKYASQKGTIDTLNLVRSLTGEGGENNGGTLAQLQNESRVLGNTTFTDFNQLKNWVETHVGEPGVPAFRATLYSVSDEMAKIVGGGTATVEGQRQAQEILNTAFSNRQASAAVSAVRGAMANRLNGLVGDNRYLTKTYGKMRNPQVPQAQDIPTINGVMPIKQRVVNGQTFFMFPTGVIVDRRARTVDPNTFQVQQ